MASPKSASPRILYYDIETSLQLAAIFGLAHNDWIDPGNLVSERYVICAAWKWEGDSKVSSVSVLDDAKRYKKDQSDDYHVVKTLYDVMAQADVIVGHNSDQFDNRWMNTRILFHGLKPLPPVTTLDTYKIAKQKFLFNSNKLDYIGKMLGVGQKMETSKGLWLKVLNGDKDAIVEMEKYNKQDVNLLEQVFLKLRPYCSAHINRELFGGEVGCPRCGSTKVQSRGIHRAITKVYQRWACGECGGWFRTLKAEQGTTEFRVL